MKKMKIANNIFMSVLPFTSLTPLSPVLTPFILVFPVPWNLEHVGLSLH